jgi:hypothetical protein
VAIAGQRIPVSAGSRTTGRAPACTAKGAPLIHESLELKPSSKPSALWARPEAWLLAASIAWCAVLGCGLVYVILIAML